MCEEDAGGRDVSGELLEPEGGAAQQARDRDPGVARAAPQPRHRVQEREGEGPHRAQHQQRQVGSLASVSLAVFIILLQGVHRHQAGR